MFLRKYGNLLAGMLFLAFTIVYALQIPGIRITRMALINSAFYPKIVAVFLLLLSCLQIVVSVVVLRRAQPSAAAPDKKDIRCVILTLMLALAYTLALEPVGFLISSVVYIFVQTIVMCPRNEMRPAKFAFIAVVASFVIYYAFRNGLSLMLPAGPLVGIL